MPKPNQNKTAPVLLTVSGMLEEMAPAKNRPGCVLEMSNGRTTGKYYVPLSPHDCRRQFPEKTRVSFQVRMDQKPGQDGVIDTAGPVGRLWETAGQET